MLKGVVLRPGLAISQHLRLVADPEQSPHAVGLFMVQGSVKFFVADFLGRMWPKIGHEKFNTPSVVIKSGHPVATL